MWRILMSKPIAIYYRVSTDKQETDMQRVAVTDWVKKNRPGIEVRVYEDKGISGKTTKRPAFQKMLADIEAGEVGCIVTYRLDRLSRKTADALRLIMDWIEAGIELVVTDQPALNATIDDPFRMTKYAMFSEIAQLERETASRRVKAGLEAARRRGKKIGRPAGDKSLLISKIRRLRREGYTFDQISTHLKMAVSYIHKLYQDVRYDRVTN